MADVTIYVTNYCPYCTSAKRLFESKGIPYTTIDVTNDHEKRLWLVKETKQRTVPQIFIGDLSVGGYTDVAALDRSGKLDTLLAS